MFYNMNLSDNMTIIKVILLTIGAPIFVLLAAMNYFMLAVFSIL